VPGLDWRVQNLTFQWMRPVSIADRHQCLQNAFQSRGRTRPHPRKRFAMHRQFANKLTDRPRSQIKIRQPRVAADWQRRVVSRSQPQAGLRQPMADQRLEMFAAADALHIDLGRQCAMPGQDLQPVKPTVLYYQKPSRMPESVEPAYGTRRALRDSVLHRCPPVTIRLDVGRRPRQKARIGTFADRNRQHPEHRVETERKVRCAHIAQPEMFPAAKLSPVSLECRTEIGGEKFCQKQFTFSQRTKGSRANGIGAFMKHGGWINPYL
jgi:hypothetical protein